MGKLPRSKNLQTDHQCILRLGLQEHARQHKISISANEAQDADHHQDRPQKRQDQAGKYHPVGSAIYHSRFIDIARDVHRLRRLEAHTVSDNVGSQLVLVRNQFEFFGRSNRSLELNGVLKDKVLFEFNLED